MAYAAAFEKHHSKPHKAAGLGLSGVLLSLLAGKTALRIECADDGSTYNIGKDGAPDFIMQVKSRALLRELMHNPDPGLGEAYMDGKWTLERGDIGAFLTTMALGRQRLFRSPAGALFFFLLHSRPRDYDHSPLHSRQQVRFHYDIGNDLYESFLDEGMNYSCAFFDEGHKDLRRAQLNKLHTSIGRLDVQPGMKVLDIGCGWGDLTRTIAQETGASEVNGITLAKNQYDEAKRRAQSLKSAPRYFLQDYREHALAHKQYYDRVISIGMFEHVGEENHDAYFDTIAKQLKPGGKALVHSIIRSGTRDTHSLSSPWLDSYIFPGGHIPNLEDMVAIAERNGLKLRHAPYIHGSSNYAQTLRCWRENFLAHRDQLDAVKYNDRFQRMWIFYLAMCEAMFDGCGYRVGQLALERV